MMENGGMGGGGGRINFGQMPQIGQNIGQGIQNRQMLPWHRAGGPDARMGGSGPFGAGKFLQGGGAWQRFVQSPQGQKLMASRPDLWQMISGRFGG